MSQIKSLVTWLVVIVLIVIAIIVLTKKGTVEVTPAPTNDSPITELYPVDKTPWKE